MAKQLAIGKKENANQTSRKRQGGGGTGTPDVAQQRKEETPIERGRNHQSEKERRRGGTCRQRKTGELEVSVVEKRPQVSAGSFLEERNLEVGRKYAKGNSPVKSSRRKEPKRPFLLKGGSSIKK